MAEVDTRLREALEDLQGYLADTLAPLLVADAFETLLDYPPSLTAEQLRMWSFFQFQGRGGSTPISDILYHAIKKIQQLEAHELVPKERFENFLAALALALLEACPEAERERLAGQMRHLRDSIGAATALVDRLHAPGGGARAAAPSGTPTGHPHGPVIAAPGGTPLSGGSPIPAGSPFGTSSGSYASNPVPVPQPTSPVASMAPTSEELRDLKRFALALERAVALGAGGAAGGGGAEGLAQQMLVLATAGARSDEELEARLAKMRQAGVAAPAATDLFRTLVGAVPDWAVAFPGAARAPSSGSLEAVRKAVKLGGEKWQDLLKASAEQFNAGAFGRSVALLDLAERMLRDGEVDARTAEIARGHAHEAYEVTKMLQAAADRKNWPMIRRLLEFHPAWSVRDLLDALVFQPDAKKRRLFIALIEVWGPEARPLVSDRLETSIAEGSRDPNAWWYQRNLVYLLHRLPRGADDDVRRELELVSPFTTLSYHPSFQKEAIQLLSTLPGYAGVPTLVQRLGEVDRALETPDPVHPKDELWKLQGSITGALIRSGSVSARRVVLDHVFAHRSKDGDALSRLRELGRLDLSDDRDTVERLLGALRELAPRKLFGFVVGRRDEEIASVARALGGTNLPVVKQALSELVERFPHLQLDRVQTSPSQESAGGPPTGPEGPAAEAPEADTEKFAAEAAPLPGKGSLSGDLELFGLAGLLQTFSQSETTGRLMLRNARGQSSGEIVLHRGKLVDCRAGRLTGSMAFYQLLEVPGGGSFEFTRLEPGATAPAGAREMMGLLLEGMRRYDELQRLRVVVPDTLVLRAGSAKPTPPEEETDGDFLRQLWEKVRAGARVTDCEAALPADTYRIRSLLAHWLETGAAAAAAA